MQPNEELLSLRENGQLEKAHELCLELISLHPEDASLKAELGWILHEKIELLEPEDDSAAESVLLIQEFRDLALPTPNLLYSRILNQCLRLTPKPESLPEFVQFIGFTGFRREDFVALVNEADGRRYPSLIESVATALAKMVSDSDDFDSNVRQFMLDFVNMALDQAQVRDAGWLHYYRALLLGSLGQPQEACDVMRLVIKAKTNEYWVWQALSRLEAERDLELALKLSVRAYTLCEHEDFAVLVLSDIRVLGEQVGHYDLAKWAADTEFEYRMANGKKILPPLSDLDSSVWYNNAGRLADPDTVLQTIAKSAEEQLFASEWIPGNVIGQFESKSGTTLLKLWLNDGVNEKVFPAEDNPELAEVPVGTPVWAVVDNSGRHPRISRLKARPNGELFDGLIEVNGIVDHQNPVKALVSVFVTARDYCLLPYSRFQDVSTWETGKTIRLRCTRWKERLIAYDVSEMELVRSEWITRYSGFFRMHERGFGFVGSVFVPNHLTDEVLDERAVAGVCIKKPKGRDSHELGWMALTMVPTSRDSDYWE